MSQSIFGYNDSNGTQGPRGLPGRGISSITSGPGSNLTFNFTDSTNQDVAIPPVDFDTTDPLNLQNTTNSYSAFSVANSSGTVLLNVDTTDNIVQLLATNIRTNLTSSCLVQTNLTEDLVASNTITNPITVQGDEANQFTVKNSSNSTIFNVNTSSGEVTINGTSASQIVQTNSSNNITSSNTLTGVTFSGTATFDESTTMAGLTSSGPVVISGANNANMFEVIDNSSNVAFNVNTTTDAVTTKTNTLDDGSGNMIIGPQIELVYPNSGEAGFVFFDGETTNLTSNINQNGNFVDATNGACKIELWSGGGTSNNIGFNLALVTGQAPTRLVTVFTTDLSPDNTTVQPMNLGENNVDRSWVDIYTQNSITTVSDKNFKKNIQDENLGLDFINSLNPRKYQVINGKSGRYHHGLIAQEVEDVMNKNNVKSTDFAGLVKTVTPTTSPKVTTKPKTTTTETITPPATIATTMTETTVNYALRYEEFIAPMMKAIQELSTTIDSLTKRIQTLEHKVDG